MEEFILLELVRSDPTKLDDNSDNSSDTTLSSNEEIPIKRRKQMKIINYVETTVRRYNEDEFKNHFRLTRSATYEVIGKLDNGDVLPKHKDGREKISTEKAVLMTLWYLANMETFRQISDRFDCTISAAHTVIVKIVCWLVSIKGQYIKWPIPQRIEIILKTFQKIKGIINVIGLIDGSHIEIPKPKENQDAYCNRKGYHSILLQGIVDCDKQFIDVFCGEPGSMNDARLLRKSGIFHKLVEDPCYIGNNIVLGDSAYPNLHWLVSPFVDNGNLSPQQREFNYRHSATRIAVEHAFGLLKCRFRRLRKLDNIDITLCSRIVMACCVLHNICISNNIEIEYDPRDQNQPMAPAEPVQPGQGNRQIQVIQELFGRNV